MEVTINNKNYKIKINDEIIRKLFRNDFKFFKKLTETNIITKDQIWSLCDYNHNGHSFYNSTVLVRYKFYKKILKLGFDLSHQPDIYYTMSHEPEDFYPSTPEEFDMFKKYEVLEKPILQIIRYNIDFFLYLLRKKINIIFKTRHTFITYIDKYIYSKQDNGCRKKYNDKISRNNLINKFKLYYHVL